LVLTLGRGAVLTHSQRSSNGLGFKPKPVFRQSPPKFFVAKVELQGPNESEPHRWVEYP
jgi:hypothetical protein